jgi:hypothetical protein
MSRRRQPAEPATMSYEELRWKIFPRHEKDFTQMVMREAAARGALSYHTHDSRRSPAGFPDLVVVNPRLWQGTVYMELKMPGNYPTKVQREWLTALVDAGERVYVFRPDDWKDIISILDGSLLPGYDVVVKERRMRYTNGSQ